uniref:Uncharacterized protein n=1 Tax=Kalanchoe fedtschenkoi TaxID=63787 RepID=A0A7N0TG03_KALFE
MNKNIPISDSPASAASSSSRVISRPDEQNNMLDRRIKVEKASFASSHVTAGLEKKPLVAATRVRRLERKSTEEINKSADDFIKKFRHQLLLQRLESMENFQQMLERGT